MKLKKLLQTTFSLIILLALYVSPILAQSTNIRGELQSELPYLEDNMGTYISLFVQGLMLIGAIAALVYLIMGGIDWIMGGGDKAKIESARNKITGALIGLAVVASVFAIWRLALTFLGLDRDGTIQFSGDGGA